LDRKDAIAIGAVVIAIASLMSTSYYASQANYYQSKAISYQSQANYYESQAFQLQNYPPKLFVFVNNEWLRLNISKPGPNGNGSITVLIVSPHNGYFTVTELGFYVSNAAFLDRNLLQSDNVHLWGDGYYFPVAAGVTRTTVTLLVWGTAAVRNGWTNYGDLGTMLLEVTFHDAQTNEDYSNSTGVPVLVVG
jgi:hypothetical protein